MKACNTNKQQLDKSFIDDKLELEKTVQDVLTFTIDDMNQTIKKNTGNKNESVENKYNRRNKISICYMKRK